MEVPWKTSFKFIEWRKVVHGDMNDLFCRCDRSSKCLVEAFSMTFCGEKDIEMSNRGRLVDILGRKAD